MHVVLLLSRTQFCLYATHNSLSLLNPYEYLHTLLGSLRAQIVASAIGSRWHVKHDDVPAY
jgi:hypothetical protein